MSTTGDTANSGGMNTLDLMSASVPVRYITRVMLRNRRPMTYDEICQAVENLTTEEIDGALGELVSMGWLDSEESDDGQVIYQIKVQKKEGSEITRSRQPGSSVSSSKMAELWDAVDTGAQAAEDGTRAQREMTDYHRERGGRSGKKEGKKGGLFGLFRKKK